MKNHFLLCMILSITLVSCNQGEQLFEEHPENWVQGGEAATWTFENGELLGSGNGGNGFIMTKKTYKDFELNLEFHPDSTVNSGVFVRCKEQKLDALDCHEINIWDLHPNQDFRTGSIVTKALPLAKVNTLNQWNTYKIKVEKDSVHVWINDILTSKLKNSHLTEGYVGLQAAEEGIIKFRNVRLKQLE
nr:DUF1080 domain-containing protein [Allomuricauda sp.]